LPLGSQWNSIKREKRQKREKSVAGGKTDWTKLCASYQRGERVKRRQGDSKVPGTKDLQKGRHTVLGKGEGMAWKKVGSNLPEHRRKGEYVAGGFSVTKKK